MAYDSNTYGQSPFGNPKKASPPGPKRESGRRESGSSSGATVSDHPVEDDGLDFGPDDLPLSSVSNPTSKAPPRPTQNSTSKPSKKASKKTSGKSSSTKDTSAAEAAAFAKALSPDNMPPAVGRIAGKLGLAKTGLAKTGLAKTSLGKAFDKLTNEPSGKTDTSTRKSRTTAKAATKSSSTKKSARSGSKRKKTKAEEAAQAEAEAAVARRFREEDRSAYLSLLYKTGISMLVWAVLRLSRHELSENAIALINVLIHPLLVATVTIVAVMGLTFWLRRLLNDLARHTQQLSADAEETGGKNYRPTLEIVGDSLEYNPQLRKNFALLFDGASMLICTLVSYLITSVLFP